MGIAAVTDPLATLGNLVVDWSSGPGVTIASGTGAPTLSVKEHDAKTD